MNIEIYRIDIDLNDIDGYTDKREMTGRYNADVDTDADIDTDVDIDTEINIVIDSAISWDRIWERVEKDECVQFIIMF